MKIRAAVLEESGAPLRVTEAGLAGEGDEAVLAPAPAWGWTRSTARSELMERQDGIRSVIAR